MKILIDNGHGRETAGKRSPDGRLLEWAYNREIARRVVAELQQRGFFASLLVPEDEDIALAERCLRAKNIFYIPKTEYSITETSTEIKAQFFFLLQTCLLLALLYFFYTRTYTASTFVLSDEYMLVAIMGGVFIGYFFMKYLIYAYVNLVFFDAKRNGQFFRTLLALHSFEGILLFPIVALLTFFDIPAQTVAYYTLFVVILVKILTFYKSFVIFFRQNGLYLQIILYFCALEIIPLFALWSGLAVIANALKINF